MTASLNEARDKIDSIDREMVELLARRMEAVREVGCCKEQDADQPLRDVDRERQVFDAWSEQAKENELSSYYVGRILREILNYSRRMQEGLLDRGQDQSGTPKIRVAYQGVPSSYSELALTQLFEARHSTDLTKIGFRSFAAAVDALEADEVDYALLPIENTIAGSINEVYHALAVRPLSIVDEEIWPVDHCLVAPAGTQLEDVRVIRSHPVALQQCQRFLGTLSQCRAESNYDTAAAAEALVAERPTDAAAICSEETAERLGLEVIRRDIADERENFTRFVLISKKPERLDPRVPAKTSLVLTVNHRRGALAACLQSFSQRGINLSKLESRPRPEAPWEYLFYVDVEGSADSDDVKEALEEARSHTNHFKVLGSYPRRGPEREVTSDEPAICETRDVAPAPAVAKPMENADLPRRDVVKIGNIPIGDPNLFAVIAGPCAVENRKQMMDAATAVKEHGALVLRGGAFKPRTSPDSFQGLGWPGVELMSEVSRALEIPIVTEVLRSEDVERLAQMADALQVGARNMQNFELLKTLGTIGKPVLLKRGMSATIDDLLAAVDYIFAGGNQRVILCERGIRTFETATRSTLDLSAVPVLRERTSLPVIVDPSHAAGRRALVIPMAVAAAAVGADGIIVESHPRPEEALCDGAQALTPEGFEQLMAELGPVAVARGRSLTPG